LYSPIAYILTAFFLLIKRFFLLQHRCLGQRSAMRMMPVSGTSTVGGGGKSTSIAMLYEPFFNNMTIILMFLLRF